MSFDVWSSAVWQNLVTQAKQPLNLRQEFAKDPARAERFTLEACGITLDYSKNLITTGNLAKPTTTSRSKPVSAKTPTDVCRRQNQYF